MIEVKPAIYIYTTDANTKLLKEITAGIEEEGVLYQIFQIKTEYTARDLAYKAAQNSTLSVGIGITKNKAVLHLEKLPLEKPLFEIYNNKDFRNIGTNAARIVKSQPFKM